MDVSTRILQPFVERAGFKVRLVYAIGAAGRIARNRLFTARPDGYTIMTEVAPGAIIDELVYDVRYKAESFEPHLRLEQHRLPVLRQGRTRGSGRSRISLRRPKDAA